MGSSASEFQNRGRKTVTLPSGLLVDIRKLRLLDFVGFGELPFPSNNEPAPVEKTSKSREGLSQKEIEAYSNRAIIAAAISPKFTDQDEGYALSDVVHVRDLDDQDWNKLVEEIFAFAGVHAEVAADAESFRAQPIGPNSEGNGVDAAQIPARDSGADTGTGLSQHDGDVSGSDPAEAVAPEAPKTGS